MTKRPSLDINHPAVLREGQCLQTQTPQLGRLGLPSEEFQLCPCLTGIISLPAKKTFKAVWTTSRLETTSSLTYRCCY